MSVNLITGNLFSPIQASQDSDYQAGTLGEKTQILNVGSKMAVSIVDNSTIRCEDGVLVTREGRRVQIDNGDVVEWTIPTGTQGTTSYYIVGFRLYTDDESAQLCDTFVQSVSGPGATIAENTFRDGAVEIFVSVARVVQNGVTLKSVQSLVPLATTLDQAKEDIIRINSDLTETNSDLTNNTCTNLINPTAQTQTVNGVTLTNNGDGTYTVNGTASDKTSFSFARLTNIDILENTKLVGCPAGGAGTTYFMYITCYNGSTWAKAYIDSGNGKIVSEIPSGVNVAWLEMTITKNTTCNNLLFKPMLTTDLNAKYSDFVPYTGDSGRLNEDVAEIYDNVLDTSDIASTLAVDYAKSVSHIGMIIQSTTLDTEAKVKAIYGGTSWSLIQGRMLLGVSTSHAVNTTGGSETHTLAVANLPSHSHGLNNHTHSLNNHAHSIPQLSGNLNNNQVDIQYGDGAGSFKTISSSVANLGATYGGKFAAATVQSTGLTTNASTTGGNNENTGGNSDNTTNTGSGTAFDTMPPYKAVYIWERTA